MESDHVDDGQKREAGKPVPAAHNDGFDLDSDQPLICPMDKQDGEACESCQ
jgi:hypothetical protein